MISKKITLRQIPCFATLFVEILPTKVCLSSKPNHFGRNVALYKIFACIPYLLEPVVKEKRKMQGAKYEVNLMSGNRILIVEDNPGVADYIHTVLTDSGYDVSGIVASGEEAVDKVKELLPDMVLMDIDLAGELNGIEAAAQIDAQFDIPVIYLTGYSDDLLLQQAKITKPYGYLVKPVNLRELIATIEMTFYRHQLEKRLKESSAKYRQQLESLVKDRTAELTKANEQLQREIDERKRTEEALQESNLRLKEALVELDDKNKELEAELTARKVHRPGLKVLKNKPKRNSK